jgi:hypothetical protein
MPNWCYNSISISGEKENISMIAEIIADTNRKNADEKSGGHFKNLVGIPRNMSAEAYEKDWYDTNISYWGTKWDVEELNEDIEEDYIHLSFDSAWSPPVGFCTLLSKIYDVQVEIFYYEGGCDFCGKAIFKDGEQIEDNCYKYREGMYILDTDIFWSELEGDIEYGIQNALDETDMEESDLSVPENMKRMLDYIVEETDNQFGDFISEEDKATIIKMYAEELESMSQTQTK